MTMEMADRSKYVHLLGIGGIADIFEGVKNGIDTFDCVAPTRIARHGVALVMGGNNYFNLNRPQLAKDFSPISATCQCYTCKNFSRAYLNHLLKAKEVLAGQLISIHNIRFMNQLMSDIRSSIASNSSLSALKNQYTTGG